MKYIDADKLIAYLEQRKKQLAQWTYKEHANQRIDEIDGILDVDIDSLQQEQPEMDLEKLGGIARHLIAVKDHEEDIRLDEGEWLLLERIGYPERVNAKEGMI